MALTATLVLGGCATLPFGAASPQGDLPAADRARVTLRSGDLPAAEAAIAAGLASSRKGSKAGQDQQTAELLLLRAELRIRQGQFPQGESDALTAMALVPATPTPPPAAAGEAPAKGEAAAPKRPPLTQRAIHLRLARLLEDAGRDDDAEWHITEARQMCTADAALVERRECEREREALVRIGVARGRYARIEPLVLAEIADVQSRFGADDLRLSLALCHAARFYARQGQYTLSGPLFTRSFSLWKLARDEAFAEHTRALAAGRPSPFDDEFLRPRAGHTPFAVPCGLDEQPALLYKLGKPDVVADALRYEQRLWVADTETGTTVVAYLDALLARGADPLDVASARHAVAFVALKKGDLVRAEQELRLVSEAYAAAWPTLALSERRYRAEDYLTALENLVELLRASQRFAEAIALGERAVAVAEATLDAYDSLRLDTLLSLATTFREMRDPPRAQAAAVRYLDAVVLARGDTSADYAWALRTIAFAYLLRDEIEASQRMEMQAKAIWATQGTVAPQF